MDRTFELAGATKKRPADESSDRVVFPGKLDRRRSSLVFRNDLSRQVERLD